MNPLLNQLVALLETQTSHHRFLLNTLSKEREAIVDSRLFALTQACRDKEELIHQIQTAEQRMSELVKHLASPMNLEPNNLSVVRIAEHAPEPFRSRLLKCVSTLRSVTESIDEANGVNKQLLIHCLDIFASSLNLLNQAAASEMVYQSSGKIAAFKSGGRLVEGNI